MNKKLFLGMFAATGMLLATSCSNDELDAVQLENEAQVTFNLGTEGGIATRVISDGTGAKKLVYAVYKLDADGTPVLQNVVGSNTDGQFVDESAFDNGLTETVSVTLAKGQTYQVAFWAQNPSCTAYTTTDLTNVGVSYSATNNNDVRDAFFKTVEFTVQGNQTIDVELKRPFAQINVGVYKSDWNAAVASGIEIEKSSVVIKNAATSINLLTGEVGDETTDVEVSYASEVIPNEDLKVDLNGDKDFDDENEVYKWLSMSYILVADRNADTDNSGVLGDERATLESLKYTFTPEIGNEIIVEDGLNSVPVQRNWRTNIIGKILTGDIQFNITINPIFDGDINPDDMLKEALTNGGEVSLFSDMTLDESFAIPADKRVKINMNGNTLKVESSNIVNGKLNINNGKIIFDVDGDELNFALVANDGSTVEFENADVEVSEGTAAVHFGLYSGENVEAVVNLKNTTIDAQNGAYGIASLQYAEGFKINLEESTMIGSSVLTIYGTKNSVVTMDEKSSVNTFMVGSASKLDVVYSGEKPEVATDGTACEINYYTEDEKALEDLLQDGGEMTLADNLSLTKNSTIAEDKTVTFNLKDYTLNVNNSTSVYGELNIIDGDVNVDIDGEGIEMGFLADNGSVVNVKDVNMTVAKGNIGIAVFNKNYMNSNIEATINIENTTMTGEGKAIEVPLGAKSVKINITNSTISAGNYLMLTDVQEATIILDAQSKVTIPIAVDGSTKLTVEYAGQEPTVQGDPNNIKLIKK